MAIADHGYSKKFGKDDVPFWERKRFVLNKAARENRQKQIDKAVQNARTKCQRPPLTKEQTLCGARRIA